MVVTVNRLDRLVADSARVLVLRATLVGMGSRTPDGDGRLRTSFDSLQTRMAAAETAERGDSEPT